MFLYQDEEVPDVKLYKYSPEPSCWNGVVCLFISLWNLAVYKHIYKYIYISGAKIESLKKFCRWLKWKMFAFSISIPTVAARGDFQCVI